MPYWMIHPKHGEMPVYDTGAVERAKVHGWTVLNEGDSPLREKKPEPTFRIQEPEPYVKRKPGRPRKGE